MGNKTSESDNSIETYSEMLVIGIFELDDIYYHLESVEDVDILYKKSVFSLKYLSDKIESGNSKFSNERLNDISKDVYINLRKKIRAQKCVLIDEEKIELAKLFVKMPYDEHHWHHIAYILVDSIKIYNDDNMKLIKSFYIEMTQRVHVPNSTSHFRKVFHFYREYVEHSTLVMDDNKLLSDCFAVVVKHVGRNVSDKNYLKFLCEAYTMLDKSEVPELFLDDEETLNYFKMKYNPLAECISSFKNDNTKLSNNIRNSEANSIPIIVNQHQAPFSLKNCITVISSGRELFPKIQKLFAKRAKEVTYDPRMQMLRLLFLMNNLGLGGIRNSENEIAGKIINADQPQQPQQMPIHVDIDKRVIKYSDQRMGLITELALSFFSNIVTFKLYDVVVTRNMIPTRAKVNSQLEVLHCVAAEKSSHETVARLLEKIILLSPNLKEIVIDHNLKEIVIDHMEGGSSYSAAIFISVLNEIEKLKILKRLRANVVLYNSRGLKQILTLIEKRKTLKNLTINFASYHIDYMSILRSLEQRNKSLGWPDSYFHSISSLNNRSSAGFVYSRFLDKLAGFLKGQHKNFARDICIVFGGIKKLQQQTGDSRYCIDANVVDLVLQFLIKSYLIHFPEDINTKEFVRHYMDLANTYNMPNASVMLKIKSLLPDQYKKHSVDIYKMMKRKQGMMLNLWERSECMRNESDKLRNDSKEKAADAKLMMNDYKEKMAKSKKMQEDAEKMLGQYERMAEEYERLNEESQEMAKESYAKKMKSQEVVKRSDEVSDNYDWMLEDNHSFINTWGIVSEGYDSMLCDMNFQREEELGQYETMTEEHKLQTKKYERLIEDSKKMSKEGKEMMMRSIVLRNLSESERIISVEAMERSQELWQESKKMWSEDWCELPESKLNRREEMIGDIWEMREKREWMKRESHINKINAKRFVESYLGQGASKEKRQLEERHASKSVKRQIGHKNGALKINVKKFLVSSLGQEAEEKAAKKKRKDEGACHTKSPHPPLRGTLSHGRGETADAI